MKVIYDNSNEKRNIDVSNLYHDIAEEMAKEDLKSGSKIIKVTMPDMTGVTYKLSLRSDTMFICELSNTISDTYLDAVKPVFLTCVDPQKNAYKFYKLELLGGEVKASYGRMGVQKGELFGERSFMYPKSMFWIKYFEKLSKGYVDRTDLYIANEDTHREKITEKTEPKGKRDKSSVSSMLFSKLRSYAKQAVKRANVQVPVTEAIIDASKKLLNKMRDSEKAEEFNKYLLDLISILQRPVKTGDGTGVKRMLADDKDDFARIIERESDLIQAMEGTLTGKKPVNVGDFSDFDIEVFKATDKQKTEVLTHLSDQLKGKVKNVYRVLPKKQQAAFNKYIKNNNIKKVKQFWHGSRNENWMSIIIHSLLLNPDAKINGKMFGQGIYFAPSSMKSWNYTSFLGTYWANGRSDTAFMGLYAVAYGKPYDANSWSGSIAYNNQLIEKEGCNCLHAHAGNALMNDEVIFYNEAAVVLNYIVEFQE